MCLLSHMLQVRTDATYPAGFMDVIEIEKTGEQFRLVYDVKGRFVVHRISPEEASYKLAKVGQLPDFLVSRPPRR